MILHLANDYSGSKVYMNLVNSLDNLDVSQIVYTAIREQNLVGKNLIEFKNGDSRIIYSKILNKRLDSFFYFNKINKISKDVEEKIDMSLITCIHAHTWYSDGGVAYKLAKKYNIPFIVTIRSTDTKIFYKYLLHLRHMGKLILKNTSSIFLLNRTFDNELFNISSSFKGKSFFVPNGVDKFWLDSYKKNTGNITDITEKVKCLKLIYVGSIIPRKNLLVLAQVIIKLNKFYGYKRVQLEIVGTGCGRYYDDVMNIIGLHKEYFVISGQINDKLELKKRYEKSDLFVLPSKNETFGLVYIEAMLNNLPIIYVKNEGIDGIYDEGIGYKLDNISFDAIYIVLQSILEEGLKWDLPISDLLENHSWERIARLCKEKYNM